jgi:hypothetical protein
MMGLRVQGLGHRRVQCVKDFPMGEKKMFLGYRRVQSVKDFPMESDAAGIGSKVRVQD